MMKDSLTRFCFLLLFALAPCICRGEESSLLKPTLHVQSAERTPAALTSEIFAGTRVGSKIVAVGGHGVVLISTDEGRTFHQAHTVPVSSALTSVHFATSQIGWAVGHWGTVIKTVDGGENWAIQRTDISVDQPLFSVYFKSASEGWAVGLWSLMLHTTDGGKTWVTVALPPPPGQKKADRNLYEIFGDGKGDLFVASEQGRVLRSTDGGNSWSYLATGYTGSLWTGIALKSGTLLVGGLRGTIYRSVDDGLTWKRSSVPSTGSITDIVESDKRIVTAVSVDGAVIVSSDDGINFSAVGRPTQSILTAVVNSENGKSVFFSTNGPLGTGL